MSRTTPPNQLTERLASLSPAKQALLERRLKGVAPRECIPRRTLDDPIPLSFAQERLWFLEQLEPESSRYNAVQALRLTGPLDVDALHRAIDAIVARHEALRTTFAVADGIPTQVIADHVSIDMPVIVVAGESKAERESEIARLVSEAAARPFDLGTGPLVRPALLRIDPREHVLVVTMPHIITDGWSIGVFLRELGELYGAMAEGKPSPLRELPIQYPDFAVWQRHWLQGDVLRSQLEYWKQHLHSAPQFLELPTDRPRPAVQTFAGTYQSFTLTKELSTAIRGLSQREGTTLFMTLVAAFTALLHRYTGREDMVIGCPIANRNRPEIEEVIGFFVNTLPLRTDLSGDPTFRELLARVRQVALGGFAHQDVPFEKLVEELQPERSLSHPPLFQVMFVLQNARRQSISVPGLEVQSLPADTGTSKFDLTLFVYESEGTLRGAFEYNTDLFDAATISRMRGHFETLLEGAVRDPEQQLSRLPLLTSVERQQLLVEWNDTAEQPPEEHGLDALVEAQAKRTPDATAVLFGDRSMSYAELDARANQFARHLRSLGVTLDGRVAISVERSIEMIVAVLGIVKAGAAYVPLDPTYPQERLQFMLENAEVSAIVTENALLPRLPRTSARVVRLDEDARSIAAESTEPLPVDDRNAHSLAYVIYTSGSTGWPKGVAMPHAPLLNLLAWQRSRGGLPDGARTLQFASLSFDVSCQEIFSTLSAGGTLVLIPEALRRDAAALLDLLRAERVERLFVPFVALQQLAYAAESAPTELTSLRDVITAGEQLQITRQVAHLFSRLPGCRLHNHYGPSESHVVTATTLTGPPEQWPLLPPIGRPIANTQIYLLDAQLQPVPIGIPGELYIGGLCLARGYLGRPELTAERFIPNPFSDAVDARLYRTGDVARYRADGEIEYLGRVDHQTKIRGFRVEPGEIEAILGQHPAVQECVTTVREDTPAEKRLVAYVVAKEDRTINDSALRDFLREKLPDYMVPSAFVTLEKLPLTPSGKVDRRSLPAPDQVRSTDSQTHVAPRDALEQQLVGIWERVLGVRPIGIHDNFFDLGGHSLMAVRLFAQVRELTKKNVPLTILFKAPTVAQLADVLRQEGWSPSWSSLVPIQPGGSKPPLFCVHAGGGYVMFYRDLARHLGPDQPFYGLQAQGLDGKQPRHTSIEEMAAHYIREMRTVQPAGPYYIGGECFGGIVAYEMAQQLHAQGEKVALLALFGTFGPGYPRLLPTTTPFRYKINVLKQRFIAHHWGNLRAMEHSERMLYLREKGLQVFNAYTDVQYVRKRVMVRVRQLVGGSLGLFGKPLPEGLRETQDSMIIARRKYVLRPYPGVITLFRPTALLAGVYPDPTLGWGPLGMGGLETYDIPGLAMVLDPRAKILAKHLTVSIDRARVAERTSRARTSIAGAATTSKVPV